VTRILLRLALGIAAFIQTLVLDGSQVFCAMAAGALMGEAVADLNFKKSGMK
jgi:hypothetical protein